MEVTAEPRPSGETSRPKEFLSDDLAVALHTRLLLGNDALDPDKNVPEVTAETLASQYKETREDTVNKISAASTVDRMEYWAKKEGTFDQQMKTWIAKTISAYKNPNINSSALAATLNRLTLGTGNDLINLNNLDEANAQKLFQRYFAQNTFQVTVKGENGQFVTIPSNVKRFIDDVVASYGGSYAQLQTDLPSIQWVAAMFGDTSDELVAQLINAEAKLQNEAQAQELAHNANTDNRRDKCNGEERRILEHLKVKAAQVTYPTIGKPEVTPTPKPLKPKQISVQGNKKLFYVPLDNPDKPGTPRIFPEQKVLSPEEIAKELAIRNFIADGGNADQLTAEDAQKLNQNTEMYKRHIKAETEQMNQLRDKLGLSDDVLYGIVNKMRDELEIHLKHPPYNLDLPKIQNLPVQMLCPTQVDYYRPTNISSLAFVLPNTPVVFFNWRAILDLAEKSKITLNLASPTQIQDIIKPLLDELIPHELSHLYGTFAHWYILQTTKSSFAELTNEEKKQAEIQPARVGIFFLKAVNRNQMEHVLLERGRELMEAATDRLAFEIATKQNPRFRFAPTPEMAVLENICQKTGVPFADFIKAYFVPKTFLSLNEKLSQKVVDERGIHHVRKHYLEIIYTLMGFESNKAIPANQKPNYQLTMAFINGNINDSQKTEVKNLLEHTPDYIQLPQSTKDYMAQTLGITLEKPTTANVTELPVTLEMAKRGVADFEKVVRKLPPDLQKLVLNDPFLRTSFAGTAPTAGEYNDTVLDKMSPAQLNKFIEDLSSVSEEYRIIDHGRPNLLKSPVRSFMNLEVAARVISQNKDQFPPEAAQNPKEWILAHPEQWCHQNPKVNKMEKDKVEIRFGLLSGFPLDSAKKYRPYINARLRFQHVALPILSKEEIAFYNDYHIQSKIPFSEENQNKLKAIVEKAGGGITTQEKELILNMKKSHRRKGTAGFFAFSQADLDYAQKLEDLYRQSGMEETIARLKTELKI